MQDFLSNNLKKPSSAKMYQSYKKLVFVLLTLKMSEKEKRTFLFGFRRTLEAYEIVLIYNAFQPLTVFCDFLHGLSD